MKNVWVWALMVCLFSSACKRKVEKELPVADTLSVVAEPVRPAEPPLMPGSVTLTEDDFGSLIELSGQQKVMDEDGPLFKLSEPEVQINEGCFLFQNRSSVHASVQKQDGKLKAVEEKGERTFFHWYRLPDFRYMVSMGQQGNGPDEFNFPHLVQSCGSVRGKAYLYETTTSKLYAADTTGTLKPLPVRFETIKGSGYSNKQIVVTAPDTLYSVDNIRGGKALFHTMLQGDSTVTKQIYNLSFSKKHKGWAAYIGDFLMSPSGNRIVYAYKYFHKLVLMDKEAKVVRDISFEDPSVDAKDDQKTLGPDNVTYYWGASATDRYFFLVYSGRTPLQVSRENGKGDGYIFVEQYDWGGHPVARYKLDHWGKVFTDGKLFYLLCYMYDDPLFLYALPEDKSDTR